MMSETRRRIPELDGLRVLMIFVVSWYHIWQQSWLPPMVGSLSLDYLVRSGYVWVDGTVLLSAFLLFLPYAAAMRGEVPVPDTRTFYWRRARRILPGYYFILLLVFFTICLPWNLYYSAPYMVKDLATHFTFTFTFFYDTYIATPLGAASWTLAIEVQAYLLFPLIARGVMKRPVLTLSLLALTGWAFRAWCLWGLTDYSMVVNQLLNFTDVYVLGILGAMAFGPLSRWFEALQGKKQVIFRLLATGLFVAAFYGLQRLLMVQASSPGYAEIQANQMKFRPLYGLLFLSLVLAAPLSLKPLRLLLGNPLTKFLAGISMNYYLIHQTIIVHMKRIGFPASQTENPHMTGERSWQYSYTWWAFGISLLAAILITYLVEKPGARLMDKLRSRIKKPHMDSRPDTADHG